MDLLPGKKAVQPLVWLSLLPLLLRNVRLSSRITES